MHHKFKAENKMHKLGCCTRLRLLGISALVSLLYGCEVVPHQPYPGPGPAPYPAVIYPSQPPPNYAYEEIRRCRADNRRAHAEVVDMYEQARRTGRINPAEQQQFNAIDARLRNLRIQLGHDGLTLQECQYIGNVIASDRNEVIRMSRHDPGVARCLAENRRAHDDIYAVYNNAQRAGRIRPREAQRFQAMEERLTGFQADLKRGGLTLAECQAISRTLANERAIVVQMVVR